MKPLGKRPPKEKPLYIHQDRPVKPIPFVQIALSLLFAAALITVIKIWGGF